MAASEIQERYTGTLSYGDVSALSRADRRAHTKAVNDLIATAGAGSYEFASPMAVRCLICATTKPHLANTAHGRGGAQSGEAIIKLDRAFRVENKITRLPSAEGKGTAGHHHKHHGCLKKPKKGESLKQAAKEESVKRLATWKQVFSPISVDEIKVAPSSIKTILTLLDAAAKTNDKDKISRAEKRLQLWEVRFYVHAAATHNIYLQQHA